MKDITKTYHVKHDFGGTTITPPEDGIPIRLNINITFQTFLHLFIMTGWLGWIVYILIELIVK